MSGVAASTSAPASLRTMKATKPHSECADQAISACSAPRTWPPAPTPRAQHSPSQLVSISPNVSVSSNLAQLSLPPGTAPDAGSEGPPGSSTGSPASAPRAGTSAPKPRVVQGSRRMTRTSSLVSSTSAGRSRAGAFSEAGSEAEGGLDGGGGDLMTALRSGKVHAALELLESDPSCLNARGASPLNDVLPLLLHSLAEQYDTFGITGSEAVFFTFFRRLWQFMTPHEQTNNRTLATFFYAACKFNQLDFVAWVLPIIAARTTLSIERLIVDRLYSYNRLRHCALHYVARNGNVRLLQCLSSFVAHPLLQEASLLMQFPPGQEGMELSSLYIAAQQRHAGFVRHALAPHLEAQGGGGEGGASPFTPALRQLVLCLMVHGLIALDDTATAAWMVGEALPGLDPLIFALPMAFSGPMSLPVSLEAKAQAKLSAASAGRTSRPPNAPNCLGLHLCVYRMPPSTHQAASVPSAAAAVGIQGVGGPKETAVERVKAFAAAMSANPASSSDEEGRGRALTSHLVNAAAATTPSAPQPALRLFTWLLERFPWLASVPFAIAVGEGGAQHIEWRNAFHSACSVGHRGAAQALLAADRTLLHTYTTSGGSDSADGSSASHRGSVVENHPLWLALGQARMTGQYDFLRWLLQHYPPLVIEREIYSQCEGLYAVVPDFVKALCKATGLRLRKFMPPGAARPSDSSSIPLDRSVSSAGSTDGGSGLTAEQAETLRAAAEASLLADLAAEEAASVASGASASTGKSKGSRRRRRRARKGSHSTPGGAPRSRAGSAPDTLQPPTPAGSDGEAEAPSFWRGAGEHAGTLYVVGRATGVVPAEATQDDWLDFTPVTSAARRSARSHAAAAAGQVRRRRGSGSAPRNPVPVRPPHRAGAGVTEVTPAAQRPPHSSPEPTAQAVHKPPPQREDVKQAPPPSPQPAPAPAVAEVPPPPAPAAAVGAGSTPPAPLPQPREEHSAGGGSGLSVSEMAEEHFFSDDDEGEEVVIGSMRFHERDVIAVGSGGTEVFRGRCGRRPAAIKRMPRRQHKLREGEIATMLDLDDTDAHAAYARHVVRYYDDARDRHFLYLAMELCDCTLETAVCTARSPPAHSPATVTASDGAASPDDDVASSQGPSQAPGGAGAWQSVQAVKAHPIEVCRQVVAGVAHLHTHGVAHRDIKPNNILLKRGVAKLCDFGLARSAAAERSRHTATTAGGTPGWQPREVVAARMKGRAVTGGVRADLFGVGCVLFFILSGGAHPFGEAVLREGHILKDHFSPFRALNASSGTQDIRLVSHDAACHLIRQLLHPQPDRRMPMVQALAHPLFWDAASSIAFTAHFSDIAKRLYGVLPDPAVSPALQALEATYTRMEGVEADWAAKLAAVDAAAGRTWPAAGGGSGGGEEEWKSPLGYLRMFKRRKAHCLGLVRAVRNIAFSHAVAYVHAGTFSSVKDAHEYWLAAFPWLPVTLYEIVVSGVDHRLSEELRALLPTA